MGKILVVGVCCVDIVNYVEKYPEEDTDNRGVDQLITLGGNATNSCAVLSQLNDHSVLFVAMPSENPLFDSLMQKSGINTERCLRREEGEVPLSSIIVNLEHGTRTIVHYDGEIPEPSAEEFRREFPDLDGFSWVHFEGRNFDEVCEMLEHVHTLRHSSARMAKELKVSVELEIRVPWHWAEKLVSYADLVFVSKDFAREQEWNSMERAVKGVQEELGASGKTVICPWAEKGVTAREGLVGQFIHVDAHVPPVIVDTLGAGDSFIAACLHFFNSGLGLRETLEKAVVVAGEKVGQKGMLGLNLDGITD
ncbi:ketohexokinase isoform 1 [Aphelenchoides avenae]|nr:ketohexokinase isoform 1 [Aphelenchus avenae]